MDMRELAGDFVMYFYNNSYILNNRVSTKNFVRRKFDEYLKKTGRKLNACDKNTTLDEILKKYKFICAPNTRDEKIYKFDLKELFTYRNVLISELDQKEIQNASEKISFTQELNEVVESNVTLKVLDDFPAYKLIFEYRIMQQSAKTFLLSSKACYCCEINFTEQNDYIEHIDYHSLESNFEYRAENKVKSLSQTFEISYKLCERAQLLFTINSLQNQHDIIIEKIIVFRSGSVHYLEDRVVPYSLPPDGSNFYVNCHIFKIGYEQPLLIVYKIKDHPQGLRYVEEHHFLRFDPFPATFNYRSNHVLRRTELKVSGKLPDYPPSDEAKKMHLSGIVDTNTCTFLKSKLTEENFCDVFKHLIEMEDFAVSRFYEQSKQSGVKADGCGTDYSVKIKAPSDGESLSSILNRGDRIILTSKTRNNRNTTRNSIDSVAKFNGFITNVAGEQVYFELKGRKLPTNLTYDVSFEPSRLNIIYQHRALELLQQDKKLRARLFPKNICYNKKSSLRLNYFNTSLEKNCEQSETVQNIIENRNQQVPFIIFGPPGTGKTTVIVESILQLWKKSPNLNRILIMSGSNAACDEIAARLSKIFRKTNPNDTNFLRLYAMSCENRIENLDPDVLESSNLCYGQHFYPSLETIYTYPIVIATLTVAARLIHGQISINHFTHVFIDECGASTEPESLAGVVGILSSSARLILSGDPKQLGPILQCKTAAKCGLEKSLMERLLELECYARDPITKEYNRTIQGRLVCNYRNHRGILQLSNQLYYENALVPVAPPEITDISLQWCRLRNKKFPILFESVKGVMRQQKNSTSFCNYQELKCVMSNLMELMYFGIKGRKIQQTDVGIVSPYKLQCDLIRRELDRRGWFHVESGSVETFQGKEKSIIIASMVRSRVNTPGFLDNYRRLNVLLTRAQSLLILIGNPETLSKIGHWKNVVDYCVENNAVIGVQFSSNDNDETDSTISESLKNLSIKDNQTKRQKPEKDQNRKLQNNFKNYKETTEKLKINNQIEKAKVNYCKQWVAELAGDVNTKQAARVQPIPNASPGASNSMKTDAPILFPEHFRGNHGRIEKLATVKIQPIASDPPQVAPYVKVQSMLNRVENTKQAVRVQPLPRTVPNGPIPNTSPRASNSMKTNAPILFPEHFRGNHGRNETPATVKNQPIASAPPNVAPYVKVQSMLNREIINSSISSRSIPQPSAPVLEDSVYARQPAYNPAAYPGARVETSPKQKSKGFLSSCKLS